MKKNFENRPIVKLFEDDHAVMDREKKRGRGELRRP